MEGQEYQFTGQNSPQKGHGPTEDYEQNHHQRRDQGRAGADGPTGRTVLLTQGL